MGQQKPVCGGEQDMCEENVISARETVDTERYTGQSSETVPMSTTDICFYQILYVVL